MPCYDLITFDCYGTLIDWEAGIWAAFQHAARDTSVDLDRARVLRTYSEIEPTVEAEASRSYREVLRVTAERTAASLGWRIPDDRRDFLAESLADWPPFPDTNAALTRMAEAGTALAILSNVDDDLLAQTRRHFPVEFELCITAQQVRSYKPAPGHFEAARKRAGGRRWLHAACSLFHDVEPARALGIDVAWINRAEEPGPLNVPTFRELASLATWAGA